VTQADKLTAKQEAFAQAVASGKTQSDAYRASYCASKMTEKTVWERASVVAADNKVAARITQLKAELAAKTQEKELWSREQSIKALVPVTGSDKGTEVVAAVKELNAMHGFSVTKVEHSGLIGVVEVASQLTDAQRLEFAKALLRRNGYDLED